MPNDEKQNRQEERKGGRSFFTFSSSLFSFSSLSFSHLFLSPLGTNATALVKQNRNEYYLLLRRAKKERKTKEQKENGKLSADETPDSRARLEGDDSFRHRVFLFRHDGELYCDALSLEISIHIIIHIIICFIGAAP